MQKRGAEKEREGEAQPTNLKQNICYSGNSCETFFIETIS